MESDYVNYLSSNWVLWVNLPIVLAFGLVTYNAYAQRWGAKTGRYSTRGHITWSGRIPGGKPPYLVSYSYHVDGVLYNGQLYIPFYRVDKTIKQNPVGKEIIVYYARKEPGFSRAFKPPDHYQIIGSSLLAYLLVPLFLFNLIFAFIYMLANIQN